MNEPTLREILEKNGKLYCPRCGKQITKEHCGWGCGCTEAGTDAYTLSVDCSCGEEIVSYNGWGCIDDYVEFLIELEDYFDHNY